MGWGDVPPRKISVQPGRSGEADDQVVDQAIQDFQGHLARNGLATSGLLVVSDPSEVEASLVLKPDLVIRSPIAPRGGVLAPQFGLTGLGGRYPHQLSGGQQQRVALARALAVRPGLVLLDEPFSSLDAGLRSSVRADVQAVLRSRGTTAVLVTHDQDEALSVADQVAVVHAGRIDQCGTPQELYDHPSNPTLARFLGDANVVAATIQGDRVATPFGPLPWRVGPGMRVPQGAVTALVRPEQLRVETGDGPGMRARVARCEFHGHDTVVTVEPIAPLPAPGTPGGGEAIVGSGSVTVRSGGNLVLPDRAPVRITATGSVLTWPSAVRGSAR